MNFTVKNIIYRPIQLIVIQLGKDSCTFHLSIIKRNEIKHVCTVTDIDLVLAQLKSNKPVALILEGSGILYRSSEIAPNYLERILVGGNKNDFYINEIENAGAVGVSFVRKQTAEEYTTKISNSGHTLLYILVGSLFHFGESSLIQLPNQIEFTPNHEFQFKKQERALSKEKINENYAQSFKNKYDSEFAGLEFRQALDQTFFQSAKKQFKDKKTFKNLGIGILLFFLSALSMNYFYVNYLNQKVADKEAELTLYGENFSLLSRLEQEQQRKMALIQNSAIIHSHFSSFYLDRIGKSVPSKIQLIELQLYPLIEPLKPKQRVDLDQSTILIQGFSENSTSLDQWITHLEEFAWIRSVEVLNFSRVHATKSSFSISIHLQS